MSPSLRTASPRFSCVEEAYAWLDGHINYERWLGDVKYGEREFDLTGFRGLLARLGDPQNSVPGIHIAGSRGKGSSALALEALLRASGLRVATYMSPHLCEYRERIRFDGRPIEGDLFGRMLEQCAALGPPSPDEHPSFKTVFEYLTAIFFMSARELRAQISVVETGLGGRLDATNALPPGPVLLTRIGLEHTQLLGDTIEKIAAEKAAILKPAGWAVYTTQSSDGGALNVFSARASATSAPLISASDRCPLLASRYDARGMTLDFDFESDPLHLELPLFGPFLAENLQGALSVVSELRARRLIPLAPRESLRDALQSLRLPGRMEPRGRAEDGGPLLIADLGHCPTAALAIADAMSAHFGDSPAVALIGMMADKDHRSFMRNLARWNGWRAAICFRPETPRAADPSTLAEAARPFFPTVESHEDLSTSLKSAAKYAETGNRIVAAGSIYSLARILDWNGHSVGSGSTQNAPETQPASGPGNPGA